MALGLLNYMWTHSTNQVTKRCLKSLTIVGGAYEDLDSARPGPLLAAAYEALCGPETYESHVDSEH